MPIVPDTKDWTWVIERRCPECGFDAASEDVDRIAESIRSNAATWRRLLADPRSTRRPSDDVWSALEYACHVRDVYRIYDGRLARMLAEDDPLYQNWDQDATAVEARYTEQSPATVAAEVDTAASDIAARFETVSGDQWRRTGRRSDGATFTIDTFARYFLHDIVHHVYDVDRGFAVLDATG